MNSPHHQHHHHHHSDHHHDVHQQRLLWFFSFCNQRSSSSSSSSSTSSISSNGSTAGGGGSQKQSQNRTNKSRRRQKQAATSRNKFAIQYQQQLLKQQKQTSNVFGCDLTQHTNLFNQDDSIPNIVKSCTKFIEKHGIIFGIYRLSGMRVNIHKLRQEFDKNPKITMIDSEAISNDAHAVACVLKQYFRELPTPLLTFHMYEKFIQLFKQANTNNNNQQSKTRQPTTTQPTSPINDKIMKHYNPDQIMEYVDDNAGNCDVDTRKTDVQHQTTTTLPMTTKTTITQLHNKPISAIVTKRNTNDQAKRQTQFASSVSDSQLISLSSVVTTTTTDVKYQVKLEDLRQLLLQLPEAHYETLKYLMRHLACIAANGEKTGMDSKNVAIVWAPNLLKPRELELSAGLETLQIIGLQAVITEQLIKHHQFLFYDENDEKEQQGEKEPDSESCKESDATQDESNVDNVETYDEKMKIDSRTEVAVTIAQVGKEDTPSDRLEGREVSGVKTTIPSNKTATIDSHELEGKKEVG